MLVLLRFGEFEVPLPILGEQKIVEELERIPSYCEWLVI